MKKIILIITILLLTGCYNYTEINDLAFVSSIGIDYDVDSEKFLVTYEILNDNNTGENKNNKSYIITGSGKNIYDAFDNATLKVNNKPYFYHLKVIAISESIAKNYTKEVVDAILRNPDVKNEFFLVLIKNNKTYEILDKANEIDLDIGNKIFNMIKTNKVQSNISIDQNFEATTRYFANNLSSAILNTFTLNEMDEIIEIGLSAFDEYTYKKTFTNEESILFNLIFKEDGGITLNKKYDDKLLTINLYNASSNIKIKDSTIYFNITSNGEVKVNTTSLNLKDEKTYKKINEDFSKMLNKKLLIFIENLKKDNLDILELNNLYYEKYRKKINALQTFDIKVNANVLIDKKGLIFKFEN